MRPALRASSAAFVSRLCRPCQAPQPHRPKSPGRSGRAYGALARRALTSGAPGETNHGGAKSRLTSRRKPAKILSGWPVRAGSSRSISPWAAEASHAKAWGASFFAPVSPWRKGGCAAVPARCARHHRRAARAARNDGRRLTPCGAKRRAASAGGLRGAASDALRLSLSPLCGLFRAHRREVVSVRLAVCSWRPAAAAAGVRPSFGRPRQTAAYPATWNRSSLGSRRAKVRRSSPRSAAHKARRAGCPSAFIGFSGRCGGRKKPAARPRASQRHPPAAPCRGLRCGRRRSPPAGQNPCSTRRKPGKARRRAPLRGIALACWFRVAPAGGGRSHAVLAQAAAQTAAACCGAPLPLPLIRPRRGRVLPVVPWCARAAGRRLAAARGVGLRGARRARAPAGFWAFRPPQLLVVQDRGRACSGVVRVGAWRGGVAAVAACAAKP